MAVWHCREKEIEYGSKVLLMGIVNVTPDSFSDGGDWLDPATALTHARALETVSRRLRAMGCDPEEDIPAAPEAPAQSEE